jgi:hypothetical protein
MNLGFFHESSYPETLKIPLEPFRILSKIHEYVRKSRYLTPVLRIRIRIRMRIHRIHMFLGLPDPDLDPSIIMQK